MKRSWFTSLLVAIVFASFVSMSTAATAVKMTDDRAISVLFDSAAPTSGVFTISLDYVLMAR